MEIKARMNRKRSNKDTFILSSGFSPTRPLYSRVSSLNSLDTVKVKIFLNYNNPQVTKAFNSWVETSEAIRLLNKNLRCIHTKGS